MYDHFNWLKMLLYSRLYQVTYEVKIIVLEHFVLANVRLICVYNQVNAKE